jgi:CheY-like chemotaxis protein
VFTVRLPAHEAAPRTPADVAEPGAAAAGDGPPHVLVIDDDPAVRELLSRTLVREGFRVVLATDGERGLAAARAERPAAIILDVMMPEMDGWDVLAALKQDPELAPVPVILQTMVDDQSKGYALGAAEYLVKPLDRERLTAILRRLRLPPERGTVLVVEDEAALRELVARTLRRGGWTVRVAENGRAALASVEESAPDVLLLDLMMPEMDGFELLDAVRALDPERRISVVVVTAKDLTDDDHARLRGGVERVLRKGAYSRQELLDEVCRLVRESRPVGGAS